MNVGSIGSTALAPVRQTVDLQSLKAAVNAQADQMQALMSTKNMRMVANKVSDAKGVDIYM
jgi:hypothetical protein